MAISPKIQALSEEMIGTCDSLDPELNLSDEEHAELDELCFVCDECGWWHEMGELWCDSPDDELICEKCGESRG